MGAAYIVRGNALAVPLADASVDLIVTSPPYFALRSYRDGGQHYDGQIGSEPTPQAFLEALWAVLDECQRVLKPTGSCFINLGDKRAGSGGHNNSGLAKPSSRGLKRCVECGNETDQKVCHRCGGRMRWVKGESSRPTANGNEGASAGYAHSPATRRDAPDRYNQAAFGRPKSRMAIPERFVVGCMDRGWIYRQDIIWAKQNGLPESVTDRTRDNFEHVFHLVRSERYYSAVDEIREGLAPKTLTHRGGGEAWGNADNPDNNWSANGKARVPNLLGSLPGSVWSLPSEPLLIPAWAKERYGLPDHFACVDEETEILTRRGWLRHDQLQVGDEVAGYNLDSGTAGWTRCHAVHRYDYDSELVAVEKRDLSMRLTPNHRCLASRATWPTGHRGPLGIVEAASLGPKHFIPRSAEWEDFGEKSIGEDMAALCGWIAAEGHYQNDLVHISQSLSRNPEKVAAIDELLARFPYQLTDRGGRKSYRVGLGFLHRAVCHGTYRGQPTADVSWRLPLWLGDEVQRLMPEKLLGPWALDLPEGERRALLNAFTSGDGHRRRDGRAGIYQKERQNLDVLQALSVTLGYKTTLRRATDKWVLYLTAGGRSVTLRGTNGSSKPIPRSRYKGIVWCPTTGTGTWFARRNGSVFITGNSFPQELPRRLILGFSPPAICTICGEGRRPVVERKPMEWRESPTIEGRYQPGATRKPASGTMLVPAEATILGYACSCATPEALTRPSVVLDPFSGTGTTIGVAKSLGRVGVGVDLSADYCRLSRWRVEQSGYFKKAEQKTWGERQGTIL